MRLGSLLLALIGILGMSGVSMAQPAPDRFEGRNAAAARGAGRIVETYPEHCFPRFSDFCSVGIAEIASVSLPKKNRNRLIIVDASGWATPDTERSSHSFNLSVSVNGHAIRSTGDGTNCIKEQRCSTSGHFWIDMAEYPQLAGERLEITLLAVGTPMNVYGGMVVQTLRK